jgi:chromosome partitioning protein
MRILASLETPTIAVLRDSQNYVHAAANGVGIYEMPYFRVRQDLVQMDLIIDWLDQQLMSTFEPTLLSRVNPLPKLFAS